MKRLNKIQEFVQTIYSLRSKHKLKRNFIKLLQRKEKLLFDRLRDLAGCQRYDICVRRR